MRHRPVATTRHVAVGVRPAATLALAIGAVALAACLGPAPDTARARSLTGQASEEPTGLVGPLPSANIGTRTADPAGAANLLVLAGRVGSMSLALVDDSGTPRPVGLPDPDVNWVSAAASRILATTTDGRAFISEPIGSAGSVRWHALGLPGDSRSRLRGPLSLGSLSPDGMRAAFLAADFAAAGPFDLVVLDVASGRVDTIRISLPAHGAAPQWLGDRVLLLTRERGDQPGAILVHLSSRAIVPGPGPSALDGLAEPSSHGWTEPVAGLSLASDGSGLAVASETTGRVEVAAPDGWLAGIDQESAAVQILAWADGSKRIGGLALSAGADRLAVVLTNLGGEALAIALHDRAAGWHEALQVPLPLGADRAVVAWLR